MELFEERANRIRNERGPLANRMRPESLDDIVGQDEATGKGSPLRTAIETDRLASTILYGPPGSGKTTIAHVISRLTRSHFEQMNAVTSGVKDIRDAIERAKERLGTEGERTIVFIDEIHRFNRAQQDALLPQVEDGTIILIGATTYNPLLYVIPPLVSRSIIVELKPLSEPDIKKIIVRALVDKEKGLGGTMDDVSEEALDYIARTCGGDARIALNALEIAYLSGENRKPRVGINEAKKVLARRVHMHDLEGEDHYNVASAFIKSMRGTDPDATLYWLARLLEGGDDPRFIARRMVIFASEDIGNADPRALLVAVAAFQAVEMVGMPEARICLAQAALHLATAPKSNSAIKGIDAALRDVREGLKLQVPLHLRNISLSEPANGYRYPHDYPRHWVEQEYMPVKKKYYEPAETGLEGRIKKFLEELRNPGKKEPDKKEE